MDFSSHPLAQQLIVSSNSKIKNSATVKQLTVFEAQAFLEPLGDLINPKFTAWYAKRLNEIGKEKFMECAKMARQGSDTPSHLFNWLLKRAP